MRSPLEDPQFQALYTVVGPLGRGGMGEVVRIRHRIWKVDLAAKLPLPAAVASAGGVARLRREAETWIRLPSHPHVVTCHYVRTFADTPVIFTEFVEGGSLAAAVERGAFERGRASDVVRAHPSSSRPSAAPDAATATRSRAPPMSGRWVSRCSRPCSVRRRGARGPCMRSWTRWTGPGATRSCCSAACSRTIPPRATAVEVGAELAALLERRGVHRGPG